MSTLPSLLTFYKSKPPVKKPVSVVNNSVLRNITKQQHAPVNTNNSNTRRKKMLASLSGFKSSALPKMTKRGGKKSKKSKTRKARK